MKKFIYIIIALALMAGCNTQSAEEKAAKEKAKQDSIAISLLFEQQEQNDQSKFDTLGLSKSPIKIISAKLYKRSYSKYRDIQITYKNISDKAIEAIRFEWYGENAFGEPADMGDYSNIGYGYGFTDDKIKPNKTATKYWNIYSKDGKNVVLAWPYEVVFDDGSKWSISNN